MTGEGARPPIPNKLYFRIGEVSELTGVQPYTLRHWEMEFPTLSPKKNDAGQRLYRREDIEMVHQIERLLHRDGYTTAGARRLLTAKKAKKKTAARPGVAPPPASSTKPLTTSPRETPAARQPKPAPSLSPASLRGVREALDLMDRNDRALAPLLDGASPRSEGQESDGRTGTPAAEGKRRPAAGPAPV